MTGVWDLVSMTAARGGSIDVPPDTYHRFAPDGTMGVFHRGKLVYATTYTVEERDGQRRLLIGGRGRIALQDSVFVVDERPSDGPAAIYRRR